MACFFVTGSQVCLDFTFPPVTFGIHRAFATSPKCDYISQSAQRFLFNLVNLPFQTLQGRLHGDRVNGQQQGTNYTKNSTLGKLCRPLGEHSYSWMGLLLCFSNLGERCIHHTNMFSALVHPSLLKYRQSQERASISLAISSFPPSRGLQWDHCTQVQSAELVAARVICFLIAQHAEAREGTASLHKPSAAHTACKAYFYKSFHHRNGNYITSSTGTEGGWVYEFFDKLTPSWQSLGEQMCYLGTHFVFTSKWLIWGL